MKILTEVFDEVQIYQSINESTGVKDWFVEGVFAQAEKKNRNGRVYPTSILEAQVNKYVQSHVKTSRALGELNHPKNRPFVDPEHASHLITEISKSGNDFMGKAKILNTPKGNIVKGLLEGGVQLGVSTRGLGTLKESGGVGVVQDDFILNTIDIVSDPSGIDCWVNGLQEGVEWIWEGDELVQISAEKSLIEVNKMKHIDETKLLEIFKKHICNI